MDVARWIYQASLTQHNKPALFAMPELDIECEKTMLDWAKEIEGWEDLEPVEIMVRMVENGYEMQVAPNDAVRSLEKEIVKIVT